MSVLKTSVQSRIFSLVLARFLGSLRNMVILYYQMIFYIYPMFLTKGF